MLFDILIDSLFYGESRSFGVFGLQSAQPSVGAALIKTTPIKTVSLS
jgi:hypothetical protein